MEQKEKAIHESHETTRSQTHEIDDVYFVLFRVISWMMLFRLF